MSLVRPSNRGYIVDTAQVNLDEARHAEYKAVHRIAMGFGQGHEGLGN